MVKKIRFLIVICASSLLFSQQNLKDKLGNYIDSLYSYHKIMGSFAISENGNSTFQKAVGYADAENNQKANINTQYRIGSISKTFTAVMIMQAVEENKISLNQKLSNFYPEIPNADKITIENLLQHRSGIHNLTDEAEFLQMYTKFHSEADLIKIIKNYKSDFEPGLKHDYSNSNYILLGYILQNINKKTYVDLLKMKITKPLKLNFTEVGGKIETEKNQAKSYAYNNGKYQVLPETDMSIPIGAGNLVSTPSDLIKFIIELENGKLIKKESLTKMKTFTDDYGYGVVKFPYEKTSGFGHNGGIDGFKSALFYFPELKVAVSLVVNQNNADTNSVLDKMIDVTQNKDFEMLNFKTLEIPVAELQKYVGAYSNKSIPVKFNIFINNKTLMAQATGQSAFPLDAVSNTNFKFEMADITIDFNFEQKNFVIEQAGRKNTFTKE